MAGLVDGMIRAARLDISLYEEVERDTTQTNNALIVVVLSALASGIGGAIGAASNPQSGSPILALIAGLVGAIVGWAVVTGFIYLVGTRLFGGTATWGEVLRTVGFANAPGVLNILGFIPILGGLIRLVVGIWLIVATVIAIRSALDVGTGRAIISGIIGWILGGIVIGIVFAIFAVPFVVGGMMTAP
ncbi:MAG TPA: Yip1 family protein [Chloroflexota bacterium]|jgi:hypothetical protein